jgi:hypothetical protein
LANSSSHFSREFLICILHLHRALSLSQYKPLRRSIRNQLHIFEAKKFSTQISPSFERYEMNQYGNDGRPECRRLEGNVYHNLYPESEDLGSAVFLHRDEVLKLEILIARRIVKGLLLLQLSTNSFGILWLNFMVFCSRRFESD